MPSPPASVGFQMPLLGCITFKMPHWHQDATHRSAGSIFPAAFHTREQTDAHRGTLRGLHITPPSPASALCGWEGVNPDSLSTELRAGASTPLPGSRSPGAQAALEPSPRLTWTGHLALLTAAAARLGQRSQSAGVRQVAMEEGALLPWHAVTAWSLTGSFPPLLSRRA